MSHTLISPSVDEAEFQAWKAVGRVVDVLGSTLDLRTLADRVRRAMEQEFDCAGAQLCLIEGDHGLARRIAPGVDGAGKELRWPLSREFADALRAGSAVFEAPPSSLPAEFAGTRRLVLPLGDEHEPVGFLLFDLEGGHQLAEEAILVRLTNVGRLLSTILARALVHRRAIKASEKAGAAQRMQQQILDHVSHEFNTPLMIIKSSAEFARSGNDEERELFLDMHSQALERLEELVQGVLEVARSSAAGDPQGLTLEEIRKAIVGPVLDECRRRSQEIALLFEDCPRFEAEVEPDALNLALSHLVRNAVRFGLEQGGLATVRLYAATRERWEAIPPHDRLELALDALAQEGLAPEAPGVRTDLFVLEVVDSGIGIPADEHEVVFEPFTQASNSPLRGISGAGMGLPTARRLVEDHGGELRMHSVEGRGTIFSMLFPARSTD